jgi:hypothetical protein
MDQAITTTLSKPRYDFLIRESKTKEEEKYYKEIIPFIRQRIQDGVLSNHQLVEFAQIFNELNVFFSLIFIQKNHRNN